MSETISAQQGVADTRYLTECPKCGFFIPKGVLKCWKCGNSFDNLVKPRDRKK